MIPIEIAKYFATILNILILILSLIAYNSWKNKNAKEIILGNRTLEFPLIIFCLFIAIVLGLRPIDIIFGDTSNYNALFNNTQNFGLNLTHDNGEWIFNALLLFCTSHGDVSLFFSVISIGYIFFAFWGIYRLFKNNTYGAMLFYLGAFSFFSYAVNGIRNGLACAIIICIISFVSIPGKRNFLLAIFLAIIAVGIHKSTTLPLLCLLASLFIKNIKLSILFWIICILLFLIAGTFFENLFANLGFDDRLTSYLSDTTNFSNVNNLGFRIDFLIYSCLPIVLAWYIDNHNKTFNNRTYLILINTYILSNSFWILLMGASFSNRFAYLSWFLYPLVLAYPCLKLNIWGYKQGFIAGVILVGHSLFTNFMYLIYYDY